MKNRKKRIGDWKKSEFTPDSICKSDQSEVEEKLFRATRVHTNNEESKVFKIKGKYYKVKELG